MKAREWSKTAAAALALFFGNVYICRELFRIEWLRHMGSIEGAYIGIVRYALEHSGDLAWFPMWYAGVPFQNTYPPFLHPMVTLAARWFGGSPQHAYHWVTALLYCLGPVSVFALAMRLGGSRWAGIAAGAIYSVTSASAWLVPAIAADLGSRLHPRRLQTLVYYGEGPHIAALTMLPLALLLIDVAMARKKAPWFFLAVIAVAAAVLTNWLAVFALTLMIVCYVLARLGSKGWNWSDLGYVALIGAAAYCLILPLAPPSTIAVTQHNLQMISGDYRLLYHALPRWAAVILIVLVWMKVAMRRIAMHLQFAVLFTFFTALLTLGWEWFRVAIVPQPQRYHLEMEIALALLIAFVGHAVLKRFPRWVAIASLLALAVLLVQPIRQARSYARHTLLLPIDITKTTEWKTAEWLKQNWTGGRVLLSGSNAFWLAAFADIPELTGGFEQGMTDPAIREAVFQIYTGAGAGPRETEDSLLWLRAFGVEAVNVTGPSSGEFYHPFAHPEKFDGVLDPLWRDGDDVIYRVGPHASLAHVVGRSDLVAHPPLNGLDVDPLRPYVAALRNPAFQNTSFEWKTLHSAHIGANLAAGQVISVQIAWHRGWRAIANGREIPVKRDAIGLMYFDPQIVGPAEIELTYDGGTEMRIARWVSALTAFVFVVTATRAILKKSW